MAKGGGAWKVAYADFVTAMMAFFLVMWICGQDQSVKRAVSFYFNDPFGASQIAFSKKASHAGALFSQSSNGNLPMEENISFGRGRNPYLSKEPNSVGTKLVSDWLHSDKTVKAYWREQAQRQRDLANLAQTGQDKGESVERVAIRELARQMKTEVKQGIPAKLKQPYAVLLSEMVTEVNWTELAEDLLAH